MRTPGPERRGLFRHTPSRVAGATMRSALALQLRGAGEMPVDHDDGPAAGCRTSGALEPGFHGVRTRPARTDRDADGAGVT